MAKVKVSKNNSNPKINLMASNEKKDLVTGNRYVKYEGPITSIQKSWPGFEVFTYKQTDGQTKN